MRDILIIAGGCYDCAVDLVNLITDREIKDLYKEYKEWRDNSKEEYENFPNWLISKNYATMSNIGVFDVDEN